MAENEENSYTPTTVAQLIAMLQKVPQDAVVCLNIGGPQDSAYTRAKIEVEARRADVVAGSGKNDDNVVHISGWAASDDMDAFLPGQDD